MSDADDPIAVNDARLRRWRLRMQAQGHYYDILAHMRQRSCGVDWMNRRPCRADDLRSIVRGRLRLGLDGFLPRTQPPPVWLGEVNLHDGRGPAEAGGGVAAAVVPAAPAARPRNVAPAAEGHPGIPGVIRLPVAIPARDAGDGDVSTVRADTTGPTPDGKAPSK